MSTDDIARAPSTHITKPERFGGHFGTPSPAYWSARIKVLDRRADGVKHDLPELDRVTRFPPKRTHVHARRLGRNHTGDVIHA